MATQTPEPEAEFSHHEPCPKCGSKDNFARYTSGSGSCFSMGCGYYELADGSTQQEQKSGKKANPFVIGETKALNRRGISEATCSKWGYQVGKYNGKTVQVANYRDASGHIVAQKIRTSDKQFKVIGDMKQALLYGQWLWRDGGKRVVVTEGEIDAMSLSQLQNNKWPVVSIPSGAQGAKRAVKKHLEWLEQFEAVVFMFDNDSAGLQAAQECAPLLSPGKAHIAQLPLKDINEMLIAKRGGEVIDAMWDAKVYRPDGILTPSDLKEELQKPIEMGLSYPWEGMTNITYGIRTSEMIALGAGTGMGKTEFFKEIATHLLMHHKQKVGMLMLEESPLHTYKGILSKHASKLFHLPNEQWTQEEFDKADQAVSKTNRLFLYDSFGYTEYDVIKSRIRYMVVSLGCKHIFLDHITALVSGDVEGDERRQLDYIMTDLASLVRELDFCLFFISHLSTPDGTPHEEGGRVTIKHFRGSRSIGQWSSFMFGLERDQQAESEKWRRTSLIRCLKDRYSGRGTGETFYLGYEPETGRMYECSEDFDDETKGDDDDGDMF